MHILVDLAAICVILSLAYYVGATVFAIRFAFKAASAPPPMPKVAPRVAILKPLSGLTPQLPANVISHLELDYPRKEYIFGVTNYEDPAAGVPLGLKARYQFSDIALSVGEKPNCANHKIAKLIKMVERAPRAEIYVLSDADVSVHSDHLHRLVSELVADEKTGIVTCIYRALPLGGVGSRFESLVVNTDFAPMATFDEAVEPMRHAFGAAIAIKRKVLEDVGGFESLRDVLADDFFLGRMVSEKGWTVKLSSSIVTVNSEEQSFSDFWQHQLRWTRTYHSVRPISIATIVIHGPFWGLIALIASGFSAWSICAMAAVLSARTAMAALMFTRVLNTPELISDLWLVPLKDLIMTAIWAVSLTGNQVLWGGRRFRLLSAGKMEELKS